MLLKIHVFLLAVVITNVIAARTRKRKPCHSKIECPKVSCKPGELLIPSSRGIGRCCPICIPYEKPCPCSCPITQCPEGQELVPANPKEGKCCASCDPTDRTETDTNICFKAQNRCPKYKCDSRTSIIVQKNEKKGICCDSCFNVNPCNCECPKLDCTPNRIIDANPPSKCCPSCFISSKDEDVCDEY